MRCRELDIFKILGIFEKLFGNFWDLFWKFLEDFLGGGFGRIFLGGILWEEFFVYIVKVS